MRPVLTVIKITPTHDPFEDRLRLALQTREGPVLSQWLTQRMATRTVLALSRWLDQEVKPQALGGRERVAQVQQFEQSAAVARHAPQPPVVTREAQDQGLVDRIDLGRRGDRFVLSFLPRQGQPAQLTLDEMQLRQLLEIFRRVYVKAEWNLAAWPAWLAKAPAAPPPAAGTPGVLH